MAATVQLDTIPQTEGQLDEQGWQYYRYAMVYGLEGAGPALMVAAADALAGVGIIRGVRHPTIADAILRVLRPRALSNGAVEVRLAYQEKFGSTNPIYVEVGASLTTVQTNVDSSGNLMTVSYKDANNQTHTQSGMLSVYAPNVTVHIRRQERQSPGDKAKEFVGTVNNGGWDIDPSAAKRTWLCTGITGRSQDGGITFDVEYAFEYRSKTWDESVIYIDPGTGRPPTDLNLSTGLKTFQMYDAVAFNFGFVA